MADWSPEAIEALRIYTQSEERYSARVIAGLLILDGFFSEPITRNAVIAKCYDLGFTLAGSPKNRPKKEVTTARQRPDAAKLAVKRTRPKPPEVLEEIVPLREAEGLDPAHNCNILGLSRSTCHWPLWGYDQPEEKLYCGTPIPDGKIYCKAHQDLAFNRIPLSKSVRPLSWKL